MICYLKFKVSTESTRLATLRVSSLDRDEYPAIESGLLKFKIFAALLEPEIKLGISPAMIY